jgi:hypothetical protein
MGKKSTGAGRSTAAAQTFLRTLGIELELYYFLSCASMLRVFGLRRLKANLMMANARGGGAWLECNDMKKVAILQSNYFGRACLHADMNQPRSPAVDQTVIRSVTDLRGYA